MGYSELDAAYLAGYIDADGTIRLGKRHGWRNGKTFYVLAVMVTGTSRETLEWMKETFQGSVGTHGKPGPRGNGIIARKQCYAWQVQSRKAAEVLKAVEPFLRVKHRQCQAGLEFWTYAQACRTHTGKPLPSDYFDITKAFQERMRLYNIRGIVERLG